MPSRRVLPGRHPSTPTTRPHRSAARRAAGLVGAAACAGMLLLSGPTTAQATGGHPATAGHPSATGHDAGRVHGVVVGAAATHRLRHAVAGFRALHRQLIGGEHAAPAQTIHPAQGTSLTDVSGAAGASAEQSVLTSVRPTNSGTSIYVPTLYPPGGSCIEVTTVYNTTWREVAAWDWCQAITFRAAVPIDASFMATYTSNGAYRVDVHRTDAASNTWTASLYNFSTGGWETLFTSSGSTQAGTTGWDIYELYSDLDATGTSYACSTMSGKTFESSNIQVRINGSWQAAGPGNAGQRFDQPHSAFRCPDMRYQMVNPYDHWKAVG